MSRPRPTIHKLDMTVANQIAAGEVVERPAAVIKELVENSLDAGATQIEIEFQNGGKAYMRVEDNGHGMSPEEAKLALERHATSKLITAADLLKIQTFGFRGEALPSIASVSELTLMTRIEEAIAGWEIVVHSGRLVHEKPCSKTTGTRIEIKHLFYPVPARRKFLKTDATEAAHIVELMRLYALAHPHIGFTLKEKNRIHFQAMPHTQAQDRFEAIFGRSFAQDYLPLPWYEQGTIAIQGFIGRPGTHRSSREGIQLLVNQRPIKSRLINQAIIEAYHTFVVPGRFPTAFLQIQVNPACIDVNVHPTKQEVRFRDEAEVRQAVMKHIRQTLEMTLQVRQNLPQIESSLPLSTVQVPVMSTTAPTVTFSIQDSIRPRFSEIEVPEYQLPQTVVAVPKKGPETVQPQPEGWSFVRHWEDPYTLLISPNGLVILNRKRAHRRIAFEAAMQAFSEPINNYQPLLSLQPLTQLSPVHQARLIELQEALKHQGFLIEMKENASLKGIPNNWSLQEAVIFIQDLLGSFDGGACATTEGPDTLQRYLAQKLADRSGNKREAEGALGTLALLSKLLQTGTPTHCLEGHPTYWEISRTEIFTHLP